MEHKGLFSRRVVFPVYAASSQSVSVLNKMAIAFSTCLTLGEMLADEEKPVRVRGLVAARGHLQAFVQGAKIRDFAIASAAIGRSRSADDGALGAPRGRNSGRGPIIGRDTSAVKVRALSRLGRGPAIPGIRIACHAWRDETKLGSYDGSGRRCRAPFQRPVKAWVVR